MNDTWKLSFAARWRLLQQICIGGSLGTALLASADTARAETHAIEIHSDRVMASGTSHSCAIGAYGEVKCWGSNSFGQLGDGTQTDHGPVLVPGLANAVEVAAGDSHTCALLADGTIQCWGDNSNGQLGSGGFFGSSSRPAPVFQIGGAFLGAISIAAGAFHTCAVLANGTVRCWGNTSSDQLGTDGSSATPFVPLSVPFTYGSGSIRSITAGSEHTCALRNDGFVVCWGQNTHGQVGDGTTIPRPHSTLVSGIGGSTGLSAVAISAGRLHTCALVVVAQNKLPAPKYRDMTVVCWGANINGQLGDGTTVDRVAPAFAGGVSSVQGVSANGDHTCALLANGTLKCWGDNSDGEMGGGIASAPVLTPTPVALAPPSPVRQVSAGYFHNCGVLANGTVNCWGNSWRSQDGNSPAYPPQAPTTVVALNGSSTAALVSAGPQLAVGDWHTCNVLPGGTATCWGHNLFGELGAGDTTAHTGPVTVAGLTNAAAMCAGTYHSCALIADGTVKCWGRGNEGQLGTGSFPASAVLTPSSVGSVSALSNVVGITCGSYHTCATIANGTIACWGSDSNGELGDNLPTSTGSANPVLVTRTDGSSFDLNRVVAAGLHDTCAIDGNGIVSCWGKGDTGQLGTNVSIVKQTTPVNVTLLNGITANSLAAGDAHNCVVSDGTVECWGANAFGQIGNGTTTTAWTPVNVAVGHGIKNLGLGANHSCAVLANGSAKCWGANGVAQTGTGLAASFLTAPTSVTPFTFGAVIGGGSQHTCALLGNDAPDCWGSDTFHQTETGF